MKNIKERKFAQEGCKHHLGFAPSLENIILLDSTIYKGNCEFVFFTVKECKHTYSYDGYTLQINLLDNSSENHQFKALII